VREFEAIADPAKCRHFRQPAAVHIVIGEM
jgi:hypothetical protein